MPTQSGHSGDSSCGGSESGLGLRASDCQPAITPDERLLAAEREARNFLAAYERVRGEALVYRDQRDAHVTRVNELNERATRAERQLAEATKNHEVELATIQQKLKQARRRLAAARKQLTALEQSRAVVLSRKLRALVSVPARAWRESHAARRSRLELESASPVQAPDVTTTNAAAVAAPAADPASIVVPRKCVVPVEDGALDLKTAAAARASAALRERVSRTDSPLRVAAIVDDFTRQSLSLECEFQDLHPDAWRAEIESFKPDLLFVESAWRGENGSWHNTVPKLPTELREILQYCRDNEIPTVFWNKEDPVHFQTFLRVASEFDHVYTTDMDCVPNYRAALGHDRVHLLPFACQPRLQNPIETYERRDALGFAGGYYTRYAERMRDLDALLDGARTVLPVEIWDRNFGTTLEDYRFPAKYQQYIVGTLDPSEIEVAYKGYRFAMNLNSVKHSQSMFARRAYELLSSGTVTISNFTRGLRVMLGDLVPMSDSPAGIQRILQTLKSDDVAYDRLRLMGLRKVHSEHTYADRLRFIVASVTGEPYQLASRVVAAVVPVQSAAEAERAIDMVSEQEGVRVEVTFVTDDPEAARVLAGGDHRVLATSDLDELRASDLMGEASGIAVLDVGDWYGPTYLLDLVLSTLYSDADVIGKGSPASLVEGAIRRGDRSAAYRDCEGLVPRRALIAAQAAGQLSASSLVHGGPEALSGVRQFSVDGFDYCQNGADSPNEARAALLGSDELDTGRSTVELFSLIAASASSSILDPEALMIEPSAIANVPKRAGLTVTGTAQGVRYQSAFAKHVVHLAWIPGRAKVSEIWPDGVAHAHLDIDGDLNLMLALRFFDAAGAIVTSYTEPAGKLIEIEIPEGAEEVAFAIRVEGPGASMVRALSLSQAAPTPIVVGSSHDVLLITDHYPAYDDLYRNGFIHTRVRNYRERGVEVDVFRPRPGMPISHHEFEGTEVASGSYEYLQENIEASGYQTIIVHFLTEQIWEALRPFHDTHRIVVWVHGAEIQPWWRRAWNLVGAELERAKELSSKRVAFWRGVIDELPAQTTLVFVSRYFAEEVQTDLERKIPGSNLRIIHNPIDCSMFEYRPKSPELRKKILSVRPFASAKYANELSVAAVIELSKQEWFSGLEFCFVGDGVLFEETLAPLREFPNVIIRREFLTHEEIAGLHREYGVFLVPTRMDSQGVSRDEAMASGLVPVTSESTAVPEFVSTSEGYLAQDEDHLQLAQAIAEMYAEPEKFLSKSQAAARRVRRQSSVDVVIPAEVALIRGDDERSGETS